MAMNPLDIQKVYDQAFDEGILEERRVFDPTDGTVSARIEEREGERVLVVGVASERSRQRRTEVH